MVFTIKIFLIKYIFKYLWILGNIRLDRKNNDGLTALDLAIRYNQLVI